MRKLTPAELAEPDVILTITYLKLTSMPKELAGLVEAELRPFIGRDTGTAYVYKIPAYVARELEELVETYMQKLQSGGTG